MLFFTPRAGTDRALKLEGQGQELPFDENLVKRDLALIGHHGIDRIAGQHMPKGSTLVLAT